MATKDELQAQVTELEQRLAEAEKAGAEALAQKEQAESAKAEAEAQAQAAKGEAEEAKAEAEKVKAEAESATAALAAKADATSESSVAPGTENVEAFDVYCKIPAGMTFPLPDGRKIKLAGLPLAQLMDSQGRPLPGSGYGKTTVAADDWLYIRKTWGSLPAFRSANPVIFARAMGKGGDDQAVEQAGVTTGFEQIKVDGKDKAKGLKTEPAQK